MLENLNVHQSPFYEYDMFLGGDFNVALDTNLTEKGIWKKDMQNELHCSELLSLVNGFNLSDLWRVQNQRKSDIHGHGDQKCSCPDYIFVSDSVVNKMYGKANYSGVIF